MLFRSLFALVIIVTAVDKFSRDATESRILERCIKHSQVMVSGTLLYCATLEDMMKSEAKAKVFL